MMLNGTNRAAVYLHHIAYSDETLNSKPPGYIVLNNIKNERPDWFEYWPIRNYFKINNLDEDAFYGFFSPKFFLKTGWTHEHVHHFVDSNSKENDIFLFCPQPDINAFFINIFEGGELFNPGKIEVTEKFLESIGIRISLRTMVMDSRQIVFSNYFVAKPAFWMRWLEINELLFDAAENPSHPLYYSLNEATNYPNAQRKVFIMEAMASLILSIENKWKSKAANLFKFSWSGTRFNQFKDEAIISDALKIAYRDQGFPEYIETFSRLREKINESN